MWTLSSFHGFLSGWFWEVGTTTQESVICFHVLNWLVSTSLDFSKQTTALLWANTCNILTSGRIVKELLLNLHKYDLLGSLLLAVMEGTIFFLFAVSDVFVSFFNFPCENVDSHSANWKILSYMNSYRSSLIVMAKKYRSMKTFKKTWNVCFGWHEANMIEMQVFLL